MLKIFELIGRYFILMGKVFSRPEKAAIYRRRIVYEMESLGIDSIGLTAIISVFIGAVITLQMCINLDSPFIPRSLVGYATRETMILEFSSTVVALILAGKVGSSIASEIGTMRITEQIDALEIMGVNSASYLILPKIVAAVVFFPFLTILSIAIGMMHDCQIDSEDMVPEGYDQEPRYIPRNMLGHVQNEAMLEFMFQTALITTKHLALDEARRLELAFGDGVKPDFSPAAFLTRFANYGLTKLHELISDTDNTETMEAFMSFLNDTYEAGVGSIEASDDLEDI